MTFGLGEPRIPFVVHCAECRHEWAPVFGPLPMETVVRLLKATTSCPLCGHSTAVITGWAPKDSADINAWLHNGDTGTSSLTIWAFATGRQPVDPVTGKPSYIGEPPMDPADFGRCHRLLVLAPEWRALLPDLAMKYPRWRPLVSKWDELTALYLEESPTGRAPKLNKRMQALHRIGTDGGPEPPVDRGAK